MLTVTELFIEICEELDKASGPSCDSIGDKLLSLAASMPTAFITKPTADLEQVRMTVSFTEPVANLTSILSLLGFCPCFCYH